MDSSVQGKIHRYPVVILESHLDTLGHVNNAAYFAILDQARWEMITSNGYGVQRIQETGMGPVILEISIRFRRELLLRQKVFVETQFLSYAKKLANLQQDIIDEEKRIYCRAVFKFGLFHLKERKLAQPTQEWLIALGFQDPGSILDETRK